MTSERAAVVASDNRRSRRLRAVAIAVLLVSMLVFAFRGPGRAFTGNTHDFGVIWAGAAAWLSGGDPWDYDVLAEHFAGAGGMPAPNARSLPSLYPPTTYAMVSVVGWLDYRLARWLWAAAITVASLAVAWFVPLLARRRPTSSMGLLLMAIVLAAGPVHSAIDKGQPTPLVVVGVLAAVLLRRADRPALAGVLLGLAAALKIHLAGPFVAYEFARGRLSCGTAAAATLLAVAAMSIVPLQVNNILWLKSWTGNLAELTQGGLGDPATPGWNANQLLNLHYPLHLVFESKTLVDGLVLLYVAAFAVVTAVKLRGRSDALSDNLGLSMVAVLTILITYHRYYDAMLLVPLLAWTVPALLTRQRIEAAGALLAGATVYLPTAAAVNIIEARTILPPVVTTSHGWQMLVLPHQNVGLILLSVSLLVGVLRIPSLRQVQSGL